MERVLTITVMRHSVEPALPTQEARARASISGKQFVLTTVVQGRKILTAFASLRSKVGSKARPHQQLWLAGHALRDPSERSAAHVAQWFDQGRGLNASSPYIMVGRHSVEPTLPTQEARA
jgi:hypothetical protein